MKRLLIVDDNQMLTNMYRTTFAAAGFAVDVAHDGESGVAAARKTRPDLVLLDLMMPKMNGVEVLTALRADPDLAAVPVIVISNAYTPERTEQLWKAGATQVLTKASSSPNVLLEAIRAALSPK
jgi:DNA-binding response OmpR family regulator